MVIFKYSIIVNENNNLDIIKNKMTEWLTQKMTPFTNQTSQNCLNQLDNVFKTCDEMVNGIIHKYTLTLNIDSDPVDKSQVEITLDMNVKYKKENLKQLLE